MLAMSFNDEDDYYRRRSVYRSGVVAALCFLACALIALVLVIA